MLEQILAQIAEREPRLDVRRGVSVAALTTRAYDGTPHVCGVRTTVGHELTADLVVDAMGRGSQLPQWLVQAGLPPVHEEAEDSGFVYYTRFFSGGDGALPQPVAPLVTALGTFSIVTLPGDNGTWSVTLYVATGDQPLKRLRHARCWNAVLAACPAHAHWVEGEPLTEVVPMSGIVDRYRRLAVDGRPSVTGLALVGDASTCTNPSMGRGLTLGFMQAMRLRDVVREQLEDPRGFAEAWDRVTEAEITPWYRETVVEDRARLQEMSSLREDGTSAPPTWTGAGAGGRDDARRRPVPRVPQVALLHDDAARDPRQAGDRRARQGTRGGPRRPAGVPRTDPPAAAGARRLRRGRSAGACYAGAPATTTDS
jgi:flavin-dependent dehydrogenase